MLQVCNTLPGGITDKLALARSRHRLVEVAGAIAAVELIVLDAVPAILHSAVRSGLREDIGLAR